MSAETRLDVSRQTTIGYVTSVLAYDDDAGAERTYRIVSDGLTLEAVERATAAGLNAAHRHRESLCLVTSGN
jgi:hypothetical protein